MKVTSEFPQDFQKEWLIAGEGGNDKKGKGIFVRQRIKLLAWNWVFQDRGKWNVEERINLRAQLQKAWMDRLENFWSLLFWNGAGSEATEVLGWLLKPTCIQDKLETRHKDGRRGRSRPTNGCVGRCVGPGEGWEDGITAQKKNQQLLDTQCGVGQPGCEGSVMPTVSKFTVKA